MTELIPRMRKNPWAEQWTDPKLCSSTENNNKNTENNVEIIHFLFQSSDNSVKNKVLCFLNLF